MSDTDQMKDNLSYMKNFQPLNEEEQKIIQQAQRIMGNSSTIPCTACHYCTEGCPKQIPIVKYLEQCAEALEAETDVENSVSKTETEDQSKEGTGSTDSHILVAYFSMAGEQYVVGNIEKGNTQIIAGMIASQTGADLFQIQPVTPYPDTYEELLEVSQQESPEDPPEIADAVENMEHYDTLFIGPIWWGIAARSMDTFVEANDFTGKTVILFCTSSSYWEM